LGDKGVGTLYIEQEAPYPNEEFTHIRSPETRIGEVFDKLANGLQ